MVARQPVLSHPRGRGALDLKFPEDEAELLKNVEPTMRGFCCQRTDPIEWKHQRAFNRLAQRYGHARALAAISVDLPQQTSPKQIPGADPPVLWFSRLSRYRSPLHLNRPSPYILHEQSKIFWIERNGRVVGVGTINQ